MQGVFIGYVFIFVLLVGVVIGCGLRVISETIDDDKVEKPKYVPTISEILSVLNIIYVSYKCSPHEKECIEEAIRLFEEMMPEDEQ